MMLIFIINMYIYYFIMCYILDLIVILIENDRVEII